MFLLLALPFGTLFTFITPPLQVPDEDDHFFRAYQVSEGHLTQTWLGNQTGGFQPKSLLAFQAQVSQDLRFHPSVKQSIPTLLAMRKMPLRTDDRAFVQFPWYSPTNYFASAAGIAVARLFGGGPLALIYAGRLGNLLLWSALIYTAISLTPLLQWTFFLLALMPMSLWLASSLSADATVNGACFLFVAVTLRFALRPEPITRRRLAALLTLGAAVALAKTAYLPITLLLLLIPPAKFGGRGRYVLVFVGFVAAVFAINFGWTEYTYRDFLHSDASPMTQLVMRLHHPVGVLRAYVGQLFSIAFLCSIVGKLGWYDTRLARPMVAVYVAMLAWTTRMGRRGEDSPVMLGAGQKLIIGIAAIGIWLAVFLVADLAFTHAGNEGISSLQGRYLIPLTPLVFLLICPSPRSRVRDRGLVMGGFSAGFSVYVAVLLCLRYYVS